MLSVGCEEPGLQKLMVGVGKFSEPTADYGPYFLSLQFQVFIKLAKQEILTIIFNISMSLQGSRNQVLCMGFEQ